MTISTFWINFGVAVPYRERQPNLYTDSQFFSKQSVTGHNMFPTKQLFLPHIFVFVFHAYMESNYCAAPKGVFFVVWELHCKGRVSLACTVRVESLAGTNFGPLILGRTYLRIYFCVKWNQ